MRLQALSFTSAFLPVYVYSYPPPPVDAPKIQGVLAMYTWEGNAVNLSCEVQANPSEVTLVWLRDGQQLPGANTSNIKIFQNLAASFLEVGWGWCCVYGCV